MSISDTFVTLRAVTMKHINIFLNGQAEKRGQARKVSERMQTEIVSMTDNAAGNLPSCLN